MIIWEINSAQATGVHQLPSDPAGGFRVISPGMNDTIKNFVITL